jgi:hypothetical protein
MLNWLFDSAGSLVGDNNNKGGASDICFYMFGLLVITTTRALHRLWVSIDACC